MTELPPLLKTPLSTRRWNGWGEAGTELPLPAAAIAFLSAQVGAVHQPKDVELSKVCAGVPASRLPAHPQVLRDAETRLRYSHGQSLPDWLALRFGVIGTIADGVWLAQSEDDIAAAFAYAEQHGAIIIPHGGGTSVCGHLAPPQASDKPVLMLALARLCRLRSLRPDDRLALFEAGISGPQLEASLRPHGFTLGHFPQSFELSTLGGWIATRSSGQQSHLYGRIEQLFAGGRLLTPQGALDMKPFPASAAGPDLREWVMGSEGRAGVISQAWVRISKRPAYERFHTVFFKDWGKARAAAQALAQSGLTFSMLRVSNARETETLLALAGHAKGLGLLQRYVRLRGAGDGKCMMLLGISGERGQCRQILRNALAITKSFAGIHVGPFIGDAWAKGRYKNVYLRNSLWDQGFVVDTVETACHWSQVDALMHGVETAAINALLPFNERVHAYTHLSHVYGSGSSVYSTFVWRLGPDYAGNLQRWQALKAAVSAAIVKHGGTITHQHGVGKDLRAYLPAEKDAQSRRWLQAVIDTADPQGTLDSGNLLARNNGEQDGHE